MGAVRISLFQNLARYRPSRAPSALSFVIPAFVIRHLLGITLPPGAQTQRNQDLTYKFLWLNILRKEAKLSH